ncbi:ribosomal protein S18-alanine N-acetyltransferase [Ilumatobacter sp.]|uniref:ribosomal protein S18-alanine N-acetyltransferase n=1 Tax=Ilumatobacter sp. TaxID=1967498 RepID=UPI003B5300B0
MSVVERVLGRAGRDVDATCGRIDGAVLEIAPMRRRDLRDGVLETERHAYPSPWSTSVFQSEVDQMRSGTRHYVTARLVAPGPDRGGVRDRPAHRGAHGRIVGHAGLWFTGDEAHVTNVAVHPDLRRTGVGRELMLVLADEVVRRGCAAWTLEVRASSRGAQQLYHRFGFVPAGVRVRYYENVEDAIVMWCHDVSTEEYAARLDALRDRPLRHATGESPR